MQKPQCVREFSVRTAWVHPGESSSSTTMKAQQNCLVICLPRISLLRISFTRIIQKFTGKTLTLKHVVAKRILD